MITASHRESRPGAYYSIPNLKEGRKINFVVKGSQAVKSRTVTYYRNAMHVKYLGKLYRIKFKKGKETVYYMEPSYTIYEAYIEV